jgi:hypothetical protein
VKKLEGEFDRLYDSLEKIHRFRNRTHSASLSKEQKDVHDSSSSVEQKEDPNGNFVNLLTFTRRLGEPLGMIRHFLLFLLGAFLLQFTIGKQWICCCGYHCIDSYILCYTYEESKHVCDSLYSWLKMDRTLPEAASNVITVMIVVC